MKPVGTTGTGAWLRPVRIVREGLAAVATALAVAGVGVFGCARCAGLALQAASNAALASTAASDFAIDAFT
ncbi:hypothetical protein LYSHEL_25970 [Lysobacter helvus]|uniref:Uncharacterized protein n=2 Tax=Lysobacteraceae TaxID=32033 RepID=A0ABN6G0U2_9GAMM|nr:hypothetical protein LYSCAS_25960 [Lysobacter caseinilyticus]BCT96726.1 hypothetical protein LYSHEL_25970 [Lysobacter helvus]